MHFYVKIHDVAFSCKTQRPAGAGSALGGVHKLRWQGKVGTGNVNDKLGVGKDLFIKIRTRTVVKLLLFLYEFLWISL